MISASADFTLKAWDVDGGGAVDGHSGGVHACAVTPDGQHAVSASDDGTLKESDRRPLQRRRCGRRAPAGLGLL